MLIADNVASITSASSRSAKSRSASDGSTKAPVAWPEAPDVRIALLGVGTVGTAFLERLAAWEDLVAAQHLKLVHVANSRGAWLPSPDGSGVGVRGLRAADLAASAAPTFAQGAKAFGDARIDGSRAHPLTPSGKGLERVASSLGHRGTRIVVDATASDAVAERHPNWLAQGIHVVTASKRGQGASLARWQAIRAASEQGNARYGDAATVGAGLPLLRSLRELRAGGDRIHAIAGVLSGSLAWLFDRYDGMRSFAALVRQARDAGYTEPDPREDLSGEDVRRKLLILARASGFALASEAVEVGSLVPHALASVGIEGIDAALPLLDAPLRARHAQAHRRGERLRFIARLDSSHDGVVRARVGLQTLPPDDPLAAGGSTDNRVAIWSDRYRDRPLVIQGPGAGAGVTAAALLDDVLRIAGTPP